MRMRKCRLGVFILSLELVSTFVISLELVSTFVILLEFSSNVTPSKDIRQKGGINKHSSGMAEFAQKKADSTKSKMVGTSAVSVIPVMVFQLKLELQILVL